MVPGLGTCQLQESAEQRDRQNIKALCWLSRYSVNKGLTFWVSRGITCLFTRRVLSRELPGLPTCSGSVVFSVFWLGLVPSRILELLIQVRERALYTSVPFLFVPTKGTYQCVALWHLHPENSSSSAQAFDDLGFFSKVARSFKWTLDSSLVSQRGWKKK